MMKRKGTFIPISTQIKKKVDAIKKKSGLTKYLIYESLLQDSLNLKPKLDVKKWLN